MNKLQSKLSLIFLFVLLLSSYTSLAQKVRTVSVDNFDDLVQEIRSNVIIKLSTKRLEISTQQTFLANPNVSYETLVQGQRLQIKGVQNLTIIGDAEVPSKIVSASPHAHVLYFLNCENIRLENLEIGHIPPKGQCMGGVLAFTNCKNISLQNTLLFGSGSEGLTLDKVEECAFNNIVIRGCTKAIMSLNNCREITFKGSRFSDNLGLDLVNVFDSEKINFEACTFDLNRSGEGKPYEHYALFNAPLSLNVSSVVLNLEDCLIEDNRSQYFCRSAAAINTKNCVIEHNVFEKKYSSSQ